MMHALPHTMDNTLVHLCHAGSYEGALGAAFYIKGPQVLQKVY